MYTEEKRVKNSQDNNEDEKKADGPYRYQQGQSGNMDIETVLQDAIDTMTQ